MKGREKFSILLSLMCCVEHLLHPVDGVSGRLLLTKQLGLSHDLQLFLFVHSGAQGQSWVSSIVTILSLVGR